MLASRRSWAGAVLLAMLLAATSLVLPGCEKKEGPLERAGKRLDHAVDDLAHDEGAAERAGKRVDKALDDARRKAD